MMEAMGVDRVLTVDLHDSQAVGFFSPRVSVINLTAQPVGAAVFADIVSPFGGGVRAAPRARAHAAARQPMVRPVVVAPSGSDVHRARQFRAALTSMGVHAGLAIVLRKHKDNSARDGKDVSDDDGAEAEAGEGLLSLPPGRRTRANDADLVGEVSGSDVIIVSDLIDTGKTMAVAAHSLKGWGARRVLVFAPHGVFSKDARRLLHEAPIDLVCVTDTVPTKRQLASRGAGEGGGGGELRVLRHVSVAPILAEAIRRLYDKEVVDAMYGSMLREG